MGKNAAAADRVIPLPLNGRISGSRVAAPGCMESNLQCSILLGACFQALLDAILLVVVASVGLGRAEAQGVPATGNIASDGSNPGSSPLTPFPKAHGRKHGDPAKASATGDWIRVHHAQPPCFRREGRRSSRPTAQGFNFTRGGDSRRAARVCAAGGFRPPHLTGAIASWRHLHPCTAIRTTFNLGWWGWTHRDVSADLRSIWRTIGHLLRP